VVGAETKAEKHPGNRPSILNHISKQLLNSPQLPEPEDEEAPSTTAADVPSEHDDRQNEHTTRISRFRLTYLEWNRSKNSI
jgi:hypothetical protein